MKPKALSQAEVFATHDRIREAFRMEVKTVEVRPLREFPNLGKADRRADVLLEIFRRTRDVCQRLERAQGLAAASAVDEQQGVRPFDTDREDASCALIAAVASLHHATKIFEQHSADAGWGVHPLRRASQFEEVTDEMEEGMRPLIGGAQPKHRARRLSTIALELDCLIHELRDTEYTKEITAEHEWDDLLSTFAVEMHAVGFNDGRIAEILLNISDETGAAAIYQRRRRRKLALRQPTHRVPEP